MPTPDFLATIRIASLVFVRVTQWNGGIACSSPIWLEQDSP
jgi:hypothetical protein